MKTNATAMYTPSEEVSIANGYHRYFDMNIARKPKIHEKPMRAAILAHIAKLLVFCNVSVIASDFSFSG